MNRKIKIIDDTIVICDIFGDNIVFYVHGSLKCATLFTNFELKTTTLFEPIWAYNRTLLTNEIRHPHYATMVFYSRQFLFIFFCVAVWTIEKNAAPIFVVVKRQKNALTQWCNFNTSHFCLLQINHNKLEICFLFCFRKINFCSRHFWHIQFSIIMFMLDKEHDWNRHKIYIKI